MHFPSPDFVAFHATGARPYMFVMDRWVRHEFLPRECLLKRAIEFIPIVRKFRLELG